MTQRQAITKSLLSVVIPMHSEAENVHICWHRLKAVLDVLPEFDCEVLFIEDGSTDSTLPLLKGIASNDRRAKVVSLSRCFGHQMAVTAGLDRASGHVVIVMDGDLQDPPEFIPAMIKKWQEGFHVVYGVRTKRKEHVIKRICYALFYTALQKLSSITMPMDAGDFCLMDRIVVQHLRSMPERHRFIRGLRSWLGFRQVGLKYERDVRYAGKPKYTYTRLIGLAMDGWLSFSKMPLRLASGLGLAASSISFLAGIAVIIMRYTADYTPPGWTSAMVIVFFLGGIQLITIGIIGEYIGRIHDEVKQRPLYIVDEEINL